ncbi:isoprenoid synthase domain-containing protein [Xylariaceae sp. FL0662B]|nr:isoprenoid synthase domain-containing protein [Xylariaceae sp. FL0662B]
MSSSLKPTYLHLTTADMGLKPQDISRAFADSPPANGVKPSSPSLRGLTLANNVASTTKTSQAVTVESSSYNLKASIPTNLDFNTWTEEKERIAMSPYNYIAAEPGKEFRSLLLSSFNEWLEVPKASLEIITNAIRMLHTASLLIDDIQDNSLLRRGRPVAHRVFGIANTINSANYVYFLALQELQKLNNPKAIDIYTTEIVSLHRGQAMDLFWRDTLTCPAEEDYLEMISNKTGGLFRLAYKLMEAESSASINFLPLIQLFSLIFQIADDYKNLCSQEYGQKKGFGEDLTEGKFSFPVIHSIRSNPTNLELLYILEQKPTSDDVKRYAIKYIESTGSLDYTKEFVGELMNRAKKAVDRIDQGSGKGKAMYALLDKIGQI